MKAKSFIYYLIILLLLVSFIYCTQHAVPVKSRDILSFKPEDTLSFKSPFIWKIPTEDTIIKYDNNKEELSCTIAMTIGIGIDNYKPNFTRNNAILNSKDIKRLPFDDFPIGASGFKVPIPLKKGNNNIRLELVTESDTIKSVARTITMSPKESERFALLIGNKDYSNWESLNSPLIDIDTMENTLKNVNFNVTKVPDASKIELEKTIQKFKNKLTNAEAVVVYYSGHGNEIDGNNYLIPIDAKEVGDSINPENEFIKLESLIKEISSKGSKNLFFIDACRTILDDKMSQGFKLPTIEGILVSFAASSEQPAFDGKNGETSPYATALKNHLKRKKSVGQVLIEVDKEVREISKNPTYRVCRNNDGKYEECEKDKDYEECEKCKECELCIYEQVIWSNLGANPTFLKWSF